VICNVLYLFEDFVLDTKRRELRRGTTLLSIEPKVFDLLAFIILNRERVVSRDDLLSSVWDRRIVSESALTTCINAARSAIADSGDEQRLIKTLPRKGIRFVGSVREEQMATDAGAADKPAESIRPALALPDKPSIAVLSFNNLSSGGEPDHFGDGMADDIITALSRFSELFVIARNSSFSYRDKSTDVQQIGRELGVRYVLQGSIRRDGDRVRISVQLIDAKTSAQCWAERYDRRLEHIFAIRMMS
jgi:TolB-like protein